VKSACCDLCLEFVDDSLCGTFYIKGRTQVQAKIVRKAYAVQQPTLAPRRDKVETQARKDALKRKRLTDVV
jgi:hypothetical protein